MSRTFTLSGNSSILTANYFPPIELKTDYVCGLIDFHTFFSIPNVDTENNLFHIGQHIIEIPVGSYEFDDIVFYIASEYERLELTGAQLRINANNNTLQTELYSSKDIVYFDEERSIASLLGFSKKKLQPGINHTSDKSLMITDTNVIRIECNIITGSYFNNLQEHTIHEFAINVAPGYKIDEIPRNVIYLPIIVKEISSITVRIVNQSGKLINFRDENITLRLHLKPQE